MNLDSFIAIFWMFGSGNNHFRISISNLKQRRTFSFNDSIEITCSCYCFHIVTHSLSKIEFFSFLETASMYLLYCLLIVYARCRFQKHKIFYFLKAASMYRAHNPHYRELLIIQSKNICTIISRSFIFLPNMSFGYSAAVT